MHNTCRRALITLVGAIVLAAATIIVGFSSGSVFERRIGGLIDRPSSSQVLPDRDTAIPVPYSADRS